MFQGHVGQKQFCWDHQNQTNPLSQADDQSQEAGGRQNVVTAPHILSPCPAHQDEEALSQFQDQPTRLEEAETPGYTWDALCWLVSPRSATLKELGQIDDSGGRLHGRGNFTRDTACHKDETLREHTQCDRTHSDELLG